MELAPYSIVEIEGELLRLSQRLVLVSFSILLRDWLDTPEHHQLDVELLKSRRYKFNK